MKIIILQLQVSPADLGFGQLGFSGFLVPDFCGNLFLQIVILVNQCKLG